MHIILWYKLYIHLCCIYISMCVCGMYPNIANLSQLEKYQWLANIHIWPFLCCLFVRQ